MTAEKAKEIIDHNIKEAGQKMPPDVKDALILSSENFELLRQQRCLCDPASYPLLPSETRD